MARPSRSDAGDTLVEILLAVFIMGVAAVAILTAFETSVSTSALHRKQATAGALVRDLGEWLTGAKTTYVGTCAAVADKTAYGVAEAAWEVANPLPSGYTASVTGIAYWNNGSAQFVATCSSDPGFERIDIEVRSTDGQAVETLQIGKRK